MGCSRPGSIRCRSAPTQPNRRHLAS
jgi:hypothetical protein